jgi:hypothetical protein
MKTRHLNTMARLAALTIASALFGISSSVTAEDIPTAKGGATKLLEFNGRAVVSQSEASKSQPMPCAKCKDEAVQRVDWTARGANKPTILVSKHLCEGCATTLSTVGFGKGKQQVATHKCTSCGAENLACCNTKKGSLAATKGMEKKLEVAPLK